MEKAEIMQSRRQFLKKNLTVAAGLAVTSKMGSLATALAEEPTATATPEPYKWIPSAPPCKLIEEITATDAPEGTRSFKFTTDGRTCSRSVTFDIVGGDYILKNVVYDGGCNGGTQGIGAMAEGRPSEEVAGILKDIVCDLKKSGSPCAQQLAFGIQQALMIIKGTPCPGCSGTTCVNMK